MFVALETQRVILRNLEKQDRDFIFAEFSNPSVTRYLFDAEPLMCVEQADDIIDFYLQPEPKNQHRYILVRKDDGATMGTCGFHCLDRELNKVDIGYDLLPEFRGQGYMSECLSAMCRYATEEMKINEIRACVYPENDASARLVIGHHFVETGQYYELFRGEKYLHKIYSYFGNSSNKQKSEG